MKKKEIFYRREEIVNILNNYGIVKGAEKLKISPQKLYQIIKKENIKSEYRIL